MRVSHGRGSKNEGFGIHLVWGAPREGHKVLLKHVLRHARAACASPCREWSNTPCAASARRTFGVGSPAEDIKSSDSRTGSTG